MKRSTTTLALLALTGSAGLAHAQNLFFGSIQVSSNPNALYTTDLDGNGLSNILPSSMVVSGVAADGGAGRVFWQQPHYGSGQTQWTIHAANLNGSGHTAISTWTQRGGNTYGVAVDRSNQHVYWTDINGVNRANYNGSGMTNLVTYHHATDVEVDPAANRMFWVGNDSSGNVGVWAATLSGANQTLLATLPNYTYGITVNPNTQTVYWSDYNGGTVSAIPYAGGTPTTILNNYLYVQGLEYESVTNRLYMVNKGSASVAWMNPAGGPLTTVFTGVGQTRGEMHDVAAIVPTPGSLAILSLGCAGALRRRRRAR